MIRLVKGLLSQRFQCLYNYHCCYRSHHQQLVLRAQRLMFNDLFQSRSPVAEETTGQVRLQPLLAMLRLVVNMIKTILLLLITVGRRDPLLCPPMTR